MLAVREAVRRNHRAGRSTWWLGRNCGVIAVNPADPRRRHLGDRGFFPQHGEGATPAALKPLLPSTPRPPYPGAHLVKGTMTCWALLSEQAGKKVSLLHRVTGERKSGSAAQANAGCRLSVAAGRANRRTALRRDTLDAGTQPSSA
jgi:excinuclease ABC subunit C